MRRRFILVVAVAVAALTMATTPVAAAVRPFNPPQTLVGGCGAQDADAVMTAGGRVLGFATCPTPSGLPIRFFSRNPDGTVNPSQSSGFSGHVLGVAYDNTATYVLYVSGSTVRIGKRTHAGAFSSRQVDTGLGGAVMPWGDVIARNGQWFGVWSKQVGPGGEFAQMELFSGASALPVRRVTNSDDADDFQPTLAYSASTPVLIWSRLEGGGAPTGSDLYVTKFVAGNWEPQRVFASAGADNFTPDMQVAGGRAFVTWHRDGYIWVASNPGGTFTSRRFNTGGFGPNVAASTTSGVVDHIFLSWTSFSGNRVFFAETASAGIHGTWDGAHVAPAGTRAVATGGFATKGTTVYSSDIAVASRTQA